MKIYQRQLEECYRKLEQAGQVGQTRELRVSLGKVIDKIRLINTMDNLIHKKSEEMRQLIEEVMGDIDDLPNVTTSFDSPGYIPVRDYECISSRLKGTLVKFSCMDQTKMKDN